MIDTIYDCIIEHLEYEKQIQSSTNEIYYNTTNSWINGLTGQTAECYAIKLS